ncbi:hypothetical protein [Actinoallomurus sp. NPDC050550]|uniref:hypothetical protein n=1 Tax=Actinoallomurus sp. NPDC050550 TaxID=3154937 RepID=UPI00340608D2
MKAAALEQTLRDHPDDLVSWRVYADRFLEQGDARGELIKLAQRHAQARPTDRDALEHEMDTLVKEHQQSWDAALPPGATVLARRHGFATKVAVEWSDSAPVLIEQVIRAPFVTALRIAPAADEQEEYWDEDFDEEPEPTPSPDLDTGALATLNIGRLAELDLSYFRLGALGAEALAVSTYFRLEASGAASTVMGRLEALDLRYSRIGDAGPARGAVHRLAQAAAAVPRRRRRRRREDARVRPRTPARAAQLLEECMSIELRDRFFALSTGRAPAEEVARYRAEVDATDTEPTATLDGLAICWHPTARFKAVRFVDAERIDAGVRDLFARPSETAPYLAAVFVDPHELSFRTFENILPLDRLFADAGPDLELIELTERAEFAKDAYSFSLRLPAAARARLEHLDSLDLYVPPLNAASRGGDRFIFHSALLAEALTAAVAKAMPQSLLDGFSHVNPVFRCNRFEPGDANFHRHRDTPYYDAARRHVSRYTVLLYLTGGSGAPALDLIEGGALAEIEPFTCVVFDQRYEHEGAPYRDGRKVFLRTELVFTDPDVTHDPEIGALFSKACYLTGESVFAPELARHADAYYNQVAEAHWNGLAAGATREPFVHKRFRGVQFVANGYDFWFAKSDELSPAECAAITLLDYFNCKVGDAAFRSLCDSEVIEADGTDWIPAFLEDKRVLKDERGESPVVPFDKSMLFPEPEKPNTRELPDCACGICSGGMIGPNLDTTRNADVIEHYTRAQDSAKADIMPAPILMLGEDVVLDPDMFVVEGNRIHVLGKESLTPVNFAACQGGPVFPSAEIFITTAATVDVAHFLVPPILFAESADCYHLTFDFFRNSWMVNHEQSTVSVPMIRPFEDSDIDEDDWGDYDDEEWEDDEDEDEDEDSASGAPEAASTLTAQAN